MEITAAAQNQLDQFYLVIYAISKRIFYEISINKKIPMFSHEETIKLEDRIFRIKSSNKEIGILEKSFGNWRIYQNSSNKAIKQKFAPDELANYFSIRIQKEFENQEFSNFLYNDGMITPSDVLSTFLLLPFQSVMNLVQYFVKEHPEPDFEYSNMWLVYFKEKMDLIDYTVISGNLEIKCLSRALYHYGNDEKFKAETDKLIADLDVSFADELKLVRENYEFFQHRK